MADWRNWDIGRITVYSGTEFDGTFRYVGRVTEKHDDHLIVEADGMHLWVDDDTSELFS